MPGCESLGLTVGNLWPRWKGVFPVFLSSLIWIFLVSVKFLTLDGSALLNIDTP